MNKQLFLLIPVLMTSCSAAGDVTDDFDPFYPLHRLDAAIPDTSFPDSSDVSDSSTTDVSVLVDSGTSVDAHHDGSQDALGTLGEAGTDAGLDSTVTPCECLRTCVRTCEGNKEHWCHVRTECVESCKKICGGPGGWCS